MKKRKCLRVAVYNSKGGSGKSTCCRALAVSLMQHGYRVLIVDGDRPQWSSVDWFEARKETLGDRAALIPAAEGRAAGVLHVLSAQVPSQANTEGLWDFILWDLPGREDAEARAVLVLCDLVLVPMQPSDDDTRPLGLPLEIIKKAGEVRGEPLPAFLIINRLRLGTRSARKIPELPNFLPPGAQMLASHIRESEDWKTATDKGLCPNELKRPGEAAKDLAALTEEFLRVCHG